MNLMTCLCRTECQSSSLDVFKSALLNVSETIKMVADKGAKECVDVVSARVSLLSVVVCMCVRVCSSPAGLLVAGKEAGPEARAQK
jgi:hypothetical protein